MKQLDSTSAALLIQSTKLFIGHLKNLNKLTQYSLANSMLKVFFLPNHVINFIKLTIVKDNNKMNKKQQLENTT